jgi:hypothetical protein
LWTDLIHDEMMTQPLSMNCDISEWITWTTDDRDVQENRWLEIILKKGVSYLIDVFLCWGESTNSLSACRRLSLRT